MKITTLCNNNNYRQRNETSPIELTTTRTGKTGLGAEGNVSGTIFIEL